MEVKTINIDDSSQYDLTFKIIVIGDPDVGKSCLTGRAVKEKFDSEYAPTVGFEFLTYSVKIKDKIIKLNIWDTCGQEMYRSLISNFYRNTSLAMMVYSIDSKDSFNHINNWLKEVKIHSSPDVKIFLIGNKCDLEENREVTYKEALKFKEENRLLYFEETSAKTGKNTKEPFYEAAKILLYDHIRYNKVRRSHKNNISLSDISSQNSNQIIPNKLAKYKRNSNCC